MNTSPPPAILTRLRQETQDLHRRVERGFPILDPALTRAEYRSWLARLHGLHLPFDAALAPWADAFDIDWESRRGAPRLRRDLLALGLDAAAIDALPRCADLPVLDDPTRAWGALYVLEGSTLGGRVIARQLSQRLELDPEHGLAFFHAHGADLDGRWQVFRDRLAAYVDTPARAERVIETARATFATFERWLAAGPVPLPGAPP